MAKDKNIIFCSFCGCLESEIDFLVEGDNAFICDACIEKAKEALDADIQNNFLDTKDLLSPKQIKKELDHLIIGQDKAKMTLSVGVYNHYKRINSFNLPNKPVDSVVWPLVVNFANAPAI